MILSVKVGYFWIIYGLVIFCLLIGLFFFALVSCLLSLSSTKVIKAKKSL